MAHQISLHYPLAIQEQMSRMCLLKAIQLRISIAFALAKMDPALCQDEIVALLFDLSTLVDALQETEESGEWIEAYSLKGSAGLLAHAETLRLALEAAGCSGGEPSLEDLETFAAGLKQELERVHELAESTRIASEEPKEEVPV